MDHFSVTEVTVGYLTFAILAATVAAAIVLNHEGPFTDEQQQ